MGNCVLLTFLWRFCSTKYLLPHLKPFSWVLVVAPKLRLIYFYAIRDNWVLGWHKKLVKKTKLNPFLMKILLVFQVNRNLTSIPLWLGSWKDTLNLSQCFLKYVQTTSSIWFKSKNRIRRVKELRLHRKSFKQFVSEIKRLTIWGGGCICKRC